MYLQHALKYGFTKQAIEGLFRSGEHYTEAMDYLNPCLIHHTHVRMILETPVLKEGTGKELRRLHDIVQQAMEYEPSVPSSRPRLNSSWIPILCLSGKSTVRALLAYLTIGNFLNSSTFERKHPKPNTPILERSN